MPDIKVYWQKVKVLRAQLEKVLVEGQGKGQIAFAGQPVKVDLTEHLKHLPLEQTQDLETFEDKLVPQGVFITSLFNSDKNSTPGMTCVATVALAAQKMVDGTHTLATTEEVKKCLQHQINQKRQANRADAKLNTQRMQVIKGEAELPEHLMNAEKELAAK